MVLPGEFQIEYEVLPHVILDTHNITNRRDQQYKNFLKKFRQILLIGEKFSSIILERRKDFDRSDEGRCHMAVFLSIPQLSEYSGLSRCDIERWLNDPVNPLPHIRAGKGRGVVKIHRELFDEYAREKAKEGR